MKVGNHVFFQPKHQRKRTIARASQTMLFSSRISMHCYNVKQAHVIIYRLIINSNLKNLKFGRLINH